MDVVRPNPPLVHDTASPLALGLGGREQPCWDSSGRWLSQCGLSGHSIISSPSSSPTEFHCAWAPAYSFKLRIILHAPDLYPPPNMSVCCKSALAVIEWAGHDTH